MGFYLNSKPRGTQNERGDRSASSSSEETMDVLLDTSIEVPRRIQSSQHQSLTSTGSSGIPRSSELSNVPTRFDSPPLPLPSASSLCSPDPSDASISYIREIDSASLHQGLDSHGALDILSMADSYIGIPRDYEMPTEEPHSGDERDGSFRQRTLNFQDQHSTIHINASHSIPYENVLRYRKDDMEIVGTAPKESTPRGPHAFCRNQWLILFGAIIGAAAAVGGFMLATGNSSQDSVEPSFPISTVEPTKPPIKSTQTAGSTSSDTTMCFETNIELQHAVDGYLGTNRTSVVEQYGAIGDWCVSKITNFSSIFQDKLTFNENIENWDTSSAVTFKSMFENAIYFNQNLSNWNTSSAKSMESMFQDALSFNGDVSSWDVSKVEAMNHMFSKTQLNQSLDSWITSKVTDMSFMFSGSAFNAPIFEDVSAIKDMRSMFMGARKFNQDLSTWSMSSVEDISRMFWLATSFSKDLCSWNLSDGILMSDVFTASACPDPMEPILGSSSSSICYPCS